MNLSETVRNLSKEMNISMAEIARRTDQSPQNLSKKLNKGTLTFEDFERILKAIGVEMEVSFKLPGQESISGASNDDRLREQMEILELQLEVERKKTKYFTEMSYDIRTALDVISGGASLAKNHSKEAAKVEDYLNRTGPAIKEIARLLEDSPFNREIAITSEKPKASTNKKDSKAKQLINKRVLLVEDNELNRSLAKELIEEAGIKTEEAEDGAKAFTKILSKKGGYYDYVLMDLSMPNMDGFEATKAIRALADDAKSKIPIIAMTAKVNDEDKSKAKKVGMNSYLEKPLDMEKLIEVLEEI